MTVVPVLRGLLEVLQLDFVPRDVSDQAESQVVSWRLELPGNIRDVGLMRIYTTQRDYVGLAPLVMVSPAVFLLTSSCFLSHDSGQEEKCTFLTGFTHLFHGPKETKGNVKTMEGNENVFVPFTGHRYLKCLIIYV